MFQLVAEAQEEGEARWGRYTGCYWVYSWKRQVYGTSECYYTDMEGWREKEGYKYVEKTNDKICQKQRETGGGAI